MSFTALANLCDSLCLSRQEIALAVSCAGCGDGRRVPAFIPADIKGLTEESWRLSAGAHQGNVRGCKVIQDVAHCSNLDLPQLAGNELPDVPHSDLPQHSAQPGLCQSTGMDVAITGIQAAGAKLLFFPMCSLV